MHRLLSTGRRAAAAGVLALLASACADAPTAPRAATAPGAAFTTGGAQPRLVSNTVKYRDAGKKPGTGRAGAATLTARALLGRDGTTELEMTTGTLDAPGAPGALEKVQVKAYDWYDAHMYTGNFAYGLAGAGRIRYQGLSHGQRLQVQANVSGIDPSRTDVVTVTEHVKRRPDLSLWLYAPSSVMAGTPVNVQAVIREGNYDVGARADCVLYVDGAAADRASGIWVDAGDVVTCAFSQTLAEGTHTLQVRLERQAPADWDPSNNTASATVQVVAGTDFYYSAYADDTRSRSTYRYSQWWKSKVDGSSGEGSRDDGHDEWAQRSSIYGYMPRAVPLPFRVEASQSTAGRTVHAASFALDAPDETGSGCVSHWEGAFYFFLCTDAWSGTTSFQYERSAGTVTYHSHNFSRQVYGPTGDEYVYSYNYEYAYDYGTLVPFGSDYTFDVRVITADQTYTAATTFPLTEVVQHYVTPFACSKYDDEYQTSESCMGDDSYLRVNSGASSVWPN